jgi:hypothetical protein
MPRSAGRALLSFLVAMAFPPAGAGCGAASSRPPEETEERPIETPLPAHASAPFAPPVHASDLTLPPWSEHAFPADRQQLTGVGPDPRLATVIELTAESQPPEGWEQQLRTDAGAPADPQGPLLIVRAARTAEVGTVRSIVRAAERAGYREFALVVLTEGGEGLLRWQGLAETPALGHTRIYPRAPQVGIRIVLTARRAELGLTSAPEPIAAFTRGVLGDPDIARPTTSAPLVHALVELERDHPDALVLLRIDDSEPVAALAALLATVMAAEPGQLELSRTELEDDGP